MRLMLMVGCTLLTLGVVAEESDVVEEIVVTATKRTQAIQEIPAAISALTAQELKDKGIKDMYDIQLAVPSLHFGELLGEQAIAIRGISSFNRSPGVAVSLDGVYQARTTTAQLSQLDLARVEVMRGPQGTLYGRNSNGGAVNFISARPTETPEGYVKVGYAEFDEVLVEAVYSGPINDRNSFRISVDHRDRGEGWVENLQPGQPDQMQGEFTNFRIRWASRVTDTIDLDVTYARSEIEGPMDHYGWLTDNSDLALPGIPQLANATYVVKEPWKIYNTGEHDSDREYDLLSLTVNWELPWFTIKSISARQEFNDRFDMPRDATDFGFFQTYDISNTESFTQELNFAGGNERFDWIIGAYYLDDDYDRVTHFDLPYPIFGFPTQAAFHFNNPKYETESKALFVDGTWRVTDRMRLSAGVRRTEDEISEAHRNEFFIFIPDPLLIAVPCDTQTKEDWSSTTARAAIQYDVADSTMVYASYSEGYKAGGVVQYECNPPFNPEEVDAIEAGFKSTIFGGTTTLNFAIFDYDYTDFQVIQVIGLQTATVNAGDASVQGAELELLSSINQNWTVSAGITLLDTEYGDFINFDGIRPDLGFQQLKGNSLNNAPETSINLGITYTTPLAIGGTLTLRADAAYRSRTYFREFNERGDSQEPYTVVNLNAIWESADEQWSGRLFVRNATEEEYITFILGANTGGGRFGTWGMPRQVGFEVTRQFGAR